MKAIVFLRGAAKAVVAAVTPLVIVLVNDIAEIVEAQVGGVVAAAVTALVVYVVPNKAA